MDERDRLGKPKHFSFQYAKKSGELETYRNATLSSIHSKGANGKYYSGRRKQTPYFQKDFICAIKRI